MSGLVYEEMRGVLNTFLANVLHDAVVYVEHSKRKTVNALDIVYALKRSGRTLYGYSEPAHRKRRNHNRATVLDVRETENADEDNEAMNTEAESESESAIVPKMPETFDFEVFTMHEFLVQSMGRNYEKLFESIETADNKKHKINVRDIARVSAPFAGACRDRTDSNSINKYFAAFGGNRFVGELDTLANAQEMVDLLLVWRSMDARVVLSNDRDLIMIVRDATAHMRYSRLLHHGKPVQLDQCIELSLFCGLPNAQLDSNAKRRRREQMLAYVKQHFVTSDNGRIIVPIAVGLDAADRSKLIAFGNKPLVAMYESMGLQKVMKPYYRLQNRDHLSDALAHPNRKDYGMELTLDLDAVLCPQKATGKNCHGDAVSEKLAQAIHAIDTRRRISRLQSCTLKIDNETFYELFATDAISYLIS